MDNVCIIFTNTDNKDLAIKISTRLVEDKLAACASIDNIKSFFYWEGSVQDRDEFRIMIKAKASNYPSIEAKILELHNDTIPEVIKIDVTDGHKSYISWINNK